MGDYQGQDWELQHVSDERDVYLVHSKCKPQSHYATQYNLTNTIGPPLRDHHPHLHSPPYLPPPRRRQDGTRRHCLLPRAYGIDPRRSVRRPTAVEYVIRPPSLLLDPTNTPQTTKTPKRTTSRPQRSPTAPNTLKKTSTVVSSLAVSGPGPATPISPPNKPSGSLSTNGAAPVPPSS